MALYAVDVVQMRDYSGLIAVPMKTTNNGSAKVPHSIRDDVSVVPVTSSGTALTDKIIASAVAASLHNIDATTDLDGYLVLLDASAAPSVGAIVPLKIWKVIANTNFSWSPPKPIQLQNGIVIVFVTTIAACFTYASGGAHAFISCEKGAYNGEIS